jgi:hypothetical protein
LRHHRRRRHRSVHDYTYDTQTRGSPLVGLGTIFDYPAVFPGWI